MPYQDEFAHYSSLRRLAESERVKDLLGRFRIKDISGDPRPLQELAFIDPEPSQWTPDWILAVDGSYATVPVRNGFPGAEAAYLTIASVLLDVAKMRKLDEHRPVDPKEFRKVEETGSIDSVLPTCNVVFDAEESVKTSFRKAVFEIFQTCQFAPDGESLLDTYEALLQLKPETRQQRCPYDTCPIANATFQRAKGTYACSCSQKRPLYSTDALRFHERFEPTGSNLAIVAEVMQVLERLWAVYFLRMMMRQHWLSALRRMAIVIDGPLAVFGQPAWISQAISIELQRINAAVKAQNQGEDILLLGIQKGGHFVDHLINLDKGEEGKGNSFPVGRAALLTDGYIKKYILFSSEEGKPHGEDTYFGRTFFYKTSSQTLVVGMLPFLEEEHRDRMRADPIQYPRLLDAMHLLDQLVSVRYPNALSPLVAAHAEAAIPLHLGNKVLERLAKELIKEEQK